MALPVSFCLLFSAILTYFSISEVYGCASCGVPNCLGLGGCNQAPISPCGGFGCPQPAPPPVFFPQQSCCAPSFGCGGFGGCGRKKRETDRRRGGRRGPPRFTRQAAPRRSFFQDNPADDKFMSCCSGRGLPPACLNHCTFQTYDKNLLSRMYFHIDQCPLELAADIHFCAAQGQDHRQCCVNNGVHQTLFGGQRCLIFCNQLPGYVTKLDLTYLPCYDRFDAMKDCFYNSIMANVSK
uniref:Domain of unknown function DB domain-containing protein n=1 Tax=Plectus sambesii TaxID=2011161 RepID=A0A914UQ64_9BILA